MFQIHEERKYFIISVYFPYKQSRFCKKWKIFFVQDMTKLC